MTTKTILCLLLFAVAGCYTDNEEELDPCRISPANLHFTLITSVLNSNGCLACHNGTASGAGISLQSHAAVKALVDNGRLLGAITHASGYAPMPQGGPKLNDCDINRIKAWIDAGAPEH